MHECGYHDARQINKIETQNVEHEWTEKIPATVIHELVVRDHFVKLRDTFF